jgi:predicted neuraminidase
MKIRQLLIILLLGCLPERGMAQGQVVDKDVAVEQETLIFPLQGEHVHSSSLVQLPNGDLLVAWFQGSGERTADDVRIMGARLRAKDKTWGSPFLLADTPNLPDCNPVLFLNNSGKLFLVWIAVQANRWEHSILKVRTSTNYQNVGAPIWEWQDNILLKPGVEFGEEVANKFKELPSHGAGWAEYAPPYDRMIVEASKDSKKTSIGWMPRIKPLLLPNGRIVLPLYSDGFNLSMMALSDDDGETWTPSLPLVGRGPIQPALALDENGDIIAYLRDSGDSPSRVHESISKDNGMTWSASQKTEIPNTASVELAKLRSGYWAFLGNDIEDGRYRISLYLSGNERQSWMRKLYLENEEPGEGGYSYPSMLEDENGKLHITYSFHPSKGERSIKYLVVDPRKMIRN